MNQRRSLPIAALLCATAMIAGAQSWTVRPEWIRAHEAFLASDAMRGRGSATHDEEITAAYVASEFTGYGLQTAPGMNGYIQQAEIAGPVLAGQATLTAGAGIPLREGSDFSLLRSSGVGVSGPLVRMSIAETAKPPSKPGAVVLLTDGANEDAQRVAFRNLERSGAAAVLVAASPATDQLFTMFGSKASVPLHLADAPVRPGRPYIHIVAVHPGAFAALNREHEGEQIRLDVPNLAGGERRFTYNAVGYLPGQDPAAGALLISAHLDHLGTAPRMPGDNIYNGANDDAAGTTAVLELAHALAAGPRLRRSILFVCYGSEELGDLGSTYFGEHPPVPLKNLVANLELEMIGNQDPKMPKGVLLLTGWERSNLGSELKAHGALLGPDPHPEEHSFERSDNYALALKGVVAHTAYGWSAPPTYHHPNDDLEHLDVPFMTGAIQSLVEPVRWLATDSFVPRWNPGGQPQPGR